MLERRHQAVTALAFLTLVWGYNWVVMKVALQFGGPFSFGAQRGIAGSLLLMLALVALRLPVRPPHLLPTVLLGLLQTTGFFGLIAWALVDGAAGTSAVLAFSMPFWVLLLAWFVLHERIHGLQWPAIALAAIGLTALVLPGAANASIAGHLCALLAGLCWAGSVIVIKRLDLPDRQLGALTAWQMLIGSLPLLLLAWLVPERSTEWNTTYILALLYNIVPANALGWLLWVYVLGRLSAGVTGLSSLAVPVVGVSAAWLQLGEVPSAVEGVGMGMIFAALSLLSIEALRRRRIGASVPAPSVTDV